MMRLVRSGIRYEVVLNMTILAIFALVLSAFVIFKLLERHLIVQEIENAKVFCGGLREQLQFVVQRDNIPPEPDPRISQSLAHFYRMERVRRIQVVNVQGNPLASFERQDVKKSEQENRDFRSELTQAMVGREMSINIENPIGRFFRRIPSVTISVPVMLEQRVWGGLAVSVDLQGLGGLSGSAYRYFLIYMFLVAGVLAIFGSVLMSKLIVQPVLDLVKGTRQVSAGDLSTRVHAPAQNELGELADSFNEMNQRVQEMLGEREKNLEELERANQKLRNAQQELVQKEKLATVGRLAAGVAHEIGNPIGAIIGYAEILKAGSTSAEQGKDFIERIVKESARIDRIIRNLLGLSRPSNPHRSSIDMHEVIEQTVNLVTAQEIFKGVRVEFLRAQQRPRIMGDFHELQQVFVNLMANAANAMAGSGSLTVRVKTGIFNDYKDIPIHAGIPREAWKAQSQVVIVSVEDSGPGVQSDSVGQIFDPFFTTMEPGAGTGLGLFVVANLLNSINASIGVANGEAGGACFSMIFAGDE